MYFTYIIKYIPYKNTVQDAEIEKLVHFLKHELEIPLHTIQKYYAQPTTIPVTAFIEALTPLESACLYLHKYTNNDIAAIAKLVDRPYNSVRQAIRNAEHKDVTIERDSKSTQIPTNALRSELSPAEAIIIYLHTQKGYGPTRIGELLNKDRRNISSQISRAKKKLEVQL